MIPKHIRGAIFDLDGTLFDSMGVWMEVDRNFLNKRKIAMPEDYHDEIKSRNFPEAAKYTKARFSLTDTEEEIMREWMEMTALSYANDVVLKPHARDYLVSLRKRGIKLAVATSSKRRLYQPVFDRYGLSDFFETVVTTEETSPKHLPHVYNEAAKRLGLPPQACAVYEDILVGIKSAKAAGFYAVAVSDHASAAEEAALRAVADEYILSFKELTEEQP